MKIFVLIGLLAASSATSSLQSKAKIAFADIEKAKTALAVGKALTGQSWLSEAQGLLASLLRQGPAAKLLGKVDQAHSSAQQGKPQESQNALSRAESEAQKLDPSLGAQLGVASQRTQQGDTQGAASELSTARSTIAEKTGMAEIEDAYQKVSQAQTLLKLGETSKARSLLDKIPSMPAGLFGG